jgi:hypothetical protein
MKKSLFAAFAVGLCMTASVMAQVPSYVPTNGLVGWWPFNGNANDESGNGNNGTVNGPTLTTDRFGNTNKAYSFDGVDDIILLPSNLTNYSISFWFNYSNLTNQFSELYYYEDGSAAIVQNGNYIYVRKQNQVISSIDLSTASILNNQWNHCVVIFDSNSNTLECVINNNNIYNSNIASGGAPNFINDNQFQIGGRQFNNTNYYKGKIDDIAIWNRSLTQQEVSELYSFCAGTLINLNPVNSQNSTNSNAQFTINAVLGSTYQWQNNPLNNGWQNVPLNANYSGSTTNVLTVNNVQLSNHNQPFRAIVNAGGCIDTSDVASIIIGDTCISTIYDTLLTTVTDTLIINTTLGLPAPNNENTILIYPNPASDHITIDNGNYTAMTGYTIKIENNAGQQVFQSAINQQQFYVDLSTWSGNGLYFVHIIDAQNNTVTVRKIVLQ